LVPFPPPNGGMTVYPIQNACPLNLEVNQEFTAALSTQNIIASEYDVEQ
jgi:hypothetical protein